MVNPKSIVNSVKQQILKWVIKGRISYCWWYCVCLEIVLLVVKILKVVKKWMYPCSDRWQEQKLLSQKGDQKQKWKEIKKKQQEY